MIAEQIQEEITAYVDGELKNAKRSSNVAELIDSIPECAFECHVQQCIKNLLKNRFCCCNSSKHRPGKFAIKMQTGEKQLFSDDKPN